MLCVQNIKMLHNIIDIGIVLYDCEFSEKS